VYAAEDGAGGRAALKFLGAAALTPGRRAALDEIVGREVRFSLAARHPHLVRTHASLTVADPDRPGLDGAVVLVMDRAEHSVQDLLDAAEATATAPGGPGGSGAAARGPVPGAARILRGAAAGLAHLHAEGWLHGDLKPANILLGPGDEVWLADFGLTTELEGTHAYVPPMGTLDHMPPEWWSERTGSRGTAVRPTGDIWAYGVVAHQVLAGGLHPFPGATARARALAAQSYARGTAPLRLAPGLAEGWRELIAACLAPDHAGRAGLTAERLVARVAELADPVNPAGPVALADPVDPADLAGPAGPAGSADQADLAGSAGPAGLVDPAEPADPAGSVDPADLAVPAGPVDLAAPAGRALRPAGPLARAAPRTRRRVLLPAALAVVAAAAVAAAFAFTGGDGGATGSGGSPPRAAHATPASRLAPLAGALPAHADVPAALRPYISQAARMCVQEEVTPVLIAAMLGAESGFDARARRPSTDEYGIAMWTPRVFDAWAVDGDHDGRKDYMSSPDAIATMGAYLCWIDEQLKADGMHGDLPALTAAAYRTSVRTIVDAGGVPARVQPYVDKVHRNMADYTSA
jgi:hypothetical protein